MTERIQDRLRAFSYEEDGQFGWREVKPEICAEAAEHIDAQTKERDTLAARCAELEAALNEIAAGENVAWAQFEMVGIARAALAKQEQTDERD